MMAPQSSTLSRLIPMLGSSHDGEVIAAARAIERKLKSEKRDWHWIAEKVADADWLDDVIKGATASPPTPPAPRPAQPHPEYRPPKPRKPRWDDLGHQARIRWMDALGPVSWLTEAEKAIVVNVRRKLHVGMFIDIGPQTKKVLSRIINKAIELGVTP